MGSQFNLLREGLSFLAVVVALYALTAKERKAPYLSSTVFSSVFMLLGLPGLLFLAARVSEQLSSAGPASVLVRRLDQLSAIAFLGTMAFALVRLWSIHTKLATLRDDVGFRELPIVRSVRRLLRNRRRRPFENDPIPVRNETLERLFPEHKAEIGRRKGTSNRQNPASASFTVVVSAEDTKTADSFLKRVAAEALKAGCCVQYSTCLRHPIEMLAAITDEYNSNSGGTSLSWQEIRSRLILVDGYTKHFGYTDSVYDRWTKECANLEVTLLTSHATYAGIHTAGAKAFNHLKDAITSSNPSSPRLPTLVIYEGTHALVDLESPEQYRLFLRHVLPSERLWGGMCTLIVEIGADAPTMALPKSYADLYIELGSQAT